MKPISELNLQELMEIAKNPIKEDEFKKLPPAKRFIMSSGIKVGTAKVPAVLIWDRYITWAKLQKLKPIGRVNFFKELKLYFDKMTVSEGVVYIMSPEGFNMSPEYLVMVNKRKWNSHGKEKTEKSKAKKERKGKVAKSSESTES